MSQRIEHYKGSGFQATLLDNYSLSELQQAIPQTLAGLGWGIQTFQLSVNEIYTALSLTGAWFDFEIFVDNSSNANPETIRAALLTVLNQFMTDVTVNYLGSNIYSVNPATGQTDITDAYNNQNPQPELSLWEQIFGKGKNPNNTLPSLQNTTLSFTTIAIIAAVGYVLFTSRRK